MAYETALDHWQKPEREDGVHPGRRGDRQGIVERGVGAIAVQEAVVIVAAVHVIPDDLARGIDALGGGAIRGQRIVKRGVDAAAVKEAAANVAVAAEQVIPDDLTRVVDAQGTCAVRAIAERGVGIGCHAKLPP